MTYDVDIRSLTIVGKFFLMIVNMCSNAGEFLPTNNSQHHIYINEQLLGGSPSNTYISNTGMTCKLRDKMSSLITKAKNYKKQKSPAPPASTTSTTNTLSNMLNQKTKALKEKAVSAQNEAIAKLDQQLNDLENKSMNTITYYLSQIFGSSPDVIFFVEVVLVILLLILFIKMLPRLNGLFKKTLPYSDAEFQEAQNLPMSSFTVGEMAKVNMEVKSLDDYLAYFSRNPCELESSGAMDLQRASAILPFIMFFIQYMMPPLVIGYIIWFIIKFWPFVIDAIYGFAAALYDYFTTKIENKLGCRWYIRMITGWGCSDVSFDSYLNSWRSTYIDRPIYYQKLKYLQKMQQAKEDYYIKPYHQYITLPIQRAQINLEFAKKLYIDRALLHIQNTGQSLKVKGQIEGQKLQEKTKQASDAIINKQTQIKAQVTGESYPSKTKSGKPCKCPSQTTGPSLVSEYIHKIADNLNRVKTESDMKNVIDEIDQLYQQVDQQTNSNLNKGISCQDVDNVISNRKIYARNTLLLIIASLILLTVYSVIRGKPVWLQSLLSKTASYNLNGQLVFKRANMLPFFYIFMVIVILLLIMFI